MQDVELKAASQARVQCLLTDSRNDKVEGLGSARSLEQFQEHCGIRFGWQIIQQRAKLGGQDPSSFDVIPIPDFT